MLFFDAFQRETIRGVLKKGAGICPVGQLTEVKARMRFEGLNRPQDPRESTHLEVKA